eukprot:SAG31_NODE_1592_length_7813_cov_28.409386_1_plen_476_part_00
MQAHFDARQDEVDRHDEVLVDLRIKIADLWAVQEYAQQQQATNACKEDDDTNSTTADGVKMLKPERMGACKICLAGEYSPERSAGTCLTCPSWLHDDVSDPSTACAACAIGHHSDGGATSCADCVAGTADTNESPSTPCNTCASSRYSAVSNLTAGNAAVACVPCAAGQYNHDDTTDDGLMQYSVKHLQDYDAIFTGQASARLRVATTESLVAQVSSIVELAARDEEAGNNDWAGCNAGNMNVTIFTPASYDLSEFTVETTDKLMVSALQTKHTEDAVALQAAHESAAVSDTDEARAGYALEVGGCVADSTGAIHAACIALPAQSDDVGDSVRSNSKQPCCINAQRATIQTCTDAFEYPRIALDESLSCKLIPIYDTVAPQCSPIQMAVMQACSDECAGWYLKNVNTVLSGCINDDVEQAAGATVCTSDPPWMHLSRSGIDKFIMSASSTGNFPPRRHDNFDSCTQALDPSIGMA